MAIAAVRRAYELALLVAFAAAFAGAWKRRGRAAALRELAFGFAVSQSVELWAVALGRYRYPDWLVYFPPRPALVPLGVGLGWAALVSTLISLSTALLGRAAPRWRLAALDAALAVALDLVLDPIASAPSVGLWLWRGPGMTPYRYWLRDVPLFNFAGWFVLVFACSLELRLLDTLRGARVRWMLAFFFADLLIARALMALPW